MIYTEKINDKLVISKNRMSIVPNQKEVENMIRLENDQCALWKEIKDSTCRKVRIDNEYDFRIGSRITGELVSLMLFGGIDLGMLVSHLSGFEFRVNPVSTLIISNLALASSLFICAKSKYKLIREKKRINVEFNTIKDTLHNEIDRQKEIQNNITGDDISLTTSYVKIKSL